MLDPTFYKHYYW